MLNSGEELYTELRDKNFSAIGGILRSKTSEIQEIMKQKEKGNMSVGEMKRLVQNLPAIQALKQSLSTRKWKHILTTISQFVQVNVCPQSIASDQVCDYAGVRPSSLSSFIHDRWSRLGHIFTAYLGRMRLLEIAAEIFPENFIFLILASRLKMFHVVFLEDRIEVSEVCIAS